MKGLVLGEDELPIPGVMITVTAEARDDKWHAQTDYEGRFLIPALPSGTYEVRAERRTHRTVQMHELLVIDTHDTIVNIELRRNRHEVSCSAGEPSRPVIDTRSGDHGTVLTREALQRLPIR